MAASANDKFMKTGTSTATTLSAPGYTIGNASITVGSTTNWPTDTGVIFAIDVAEVVDGEQVRVAGSYCEFQGTVSGGTTVNNLTLTLGTPQNYAAGSLTRVYIPVSSERDERMVDGLLVEHNQDGTHGDVMADSLIVGGSATLTGNLDVNDSTTSVRDTSDNELLKFVKTASAVNEVTVTNAATGNAPRVGATGDDSNIGLNLVPKGTGEIQFNGTGVSGAWASWTPTLTNLAGGTLNYAKFKQIGKTIQFRFKYTLGGAGVSGGVTFTVPVEFNSEYNNSAEPINAVASLFDNGTAYFVGIVRWQSSTSVTVWSADASGTFLRASSLTSTNPHTWASGDVIAVSGSYEAA